MKEQIEFAQFLEIEKQLEIKVGRILEVLPVPKSDKLIILKVDFGEESPRTVVTNIKQYIGDLERCMNALLDLSFPFVTNLKPVKMMGVISEAMIMPGEIERGLNFYVNGKPGIKIL